MPIIQLYLRTSAIWFNWNLHIQIFYFKLKKVLTQCNNLNLMFSLNNKIIWISQNINLELNFLKCTWINNGFLLMHETYVLVYGICISVIHVMNTNCKVFWKIPYWNIHHSHNLEYDLATFDSLTGSSLLYHSRMGLPTHEIQSYMFSL